MIVHIVRTCGLRGVVWLAFSDEGELVDQTTLNSPGTMRERVGNRVTVSGMCIHEGSAWRDAGFVAAWALYCLAGGELPAEHIR